MDSNQNQPSEVKEGGALAPCPFCEGESEVVSGRGFYPRCMCCEVVGPTCVSIDRAIAAWNRRPPSMERGEAAPDEMTENALRNRAKALMRLKGWRPGDNASIHSMIELLTAFGMDLTRNPEADRCGYPSCGCDIDASCDVALDRLAAAPSPAPSAVEMAGVDREALARLKAWLDRGNPSGGMNLPARDGTPSIRSDLRAILALATASREKGSRAARELPLAADMSAADGPHQAFETGWLIEAWNSRTGAFGARWWSLDDDNGSWTTDSTSALRFARQADAQAYIDDIGWTEAKPTEHRWGPTKSKAAPSPASMPQTGGEA